MPLPATHLQSVQTAVKMATASDLSLRGGRRPTWQSREGSVDSVPAAVKMGNASDLSLRGGRRPTWQSRSTMVDNRKASANSQAVAGDCTPRALPRASRSGRHVAPRNDTSGWCRGAPAPLRGLIALYRALNERRYSPNLAACSFGDGLYGLQMPSRDCHVASLLAMTNRRPLPFYRYPIRIGGAAPGAACRSPTMHGRRSVYFSFFIFQSSGFISMRPSPTMHSRKPRAALHVPFSSFHFHPALHLHITLQISSFYGKSTKIRGGTRNVR